MKNKIDELILEMSGKSSMEEAGKYFESIRYTKYEKTKKLFFVIHINQLAILFRLKEELEK